LKDTVYVNNLYFLPKLKDNIHRKTVNIPTQRAPLSVKKYFLKMWGQLSNWRLASFRLSHEICSS